MRWSWVNFGERHRKIATMVAGAATGSFVSPALPHRPFSDMPARSVSQFAFLIIDVNRGNTILSNRFS
jgi:hypothetical protein